MKSFGPKNDKSSGWRTSIGTFLLSALLTSASSAGVLYTAPSGDFAVGGGGPQATMPGLSDGNDAFFTFTVNFSSFVFTDNATGDPDRQVLFENGGAGKGISLTLTPTGALLFRSGGGNSSQIENLVDLTTSGLSTGTDLRFVAGFNFADDTLDLYLNQNTVTNSVSLGGNGNLAGNDGYGVGNFGGNVGVYKQDDFSSTQPVPEIEAFAFDNGTISNFIVYDNLSEALETIAEDPSPPTLAIKGVSAGVWELTLTGEVDTLCEFRSSPDLNFSPGILATGLRQGNPSVDPGVISGSNDEFVTTDGNGDAVVRVSLSGSRNFIRAKLGRQPNVVIFFSDDHTNQAISAYQNLPEPAPQDALFKDWTVAETPQIDRLASQGMVFRNSYVNNSICSPSRASLLTGLHSHANGLFSNSQTFDGSQQTFPKLLQSVGYSTAIFGKWHLKSTPTGFDHYEVLSGDNGQGSYYSPVLNTPGGSVSYPGEYVADVTTDRALVWLQARIDGSASDPFLMFVNHKGTHRVWQPAPEEINPTLFRPIEWDYSVTPNPNTDPSDPAIWTPASVPVPPNFDDRLTGYPTRADGARSQRMEVANDLRLEQDLKLENSSFGGTAYDEVRTWWNANKDSMSNAEKHAYYQQRYLKDYMLTGKSVDRGVGEVLDFLESNDLDHNTIILYASDQGFFLGEHGWYDKRWMYTESFRTPLLIQWKDAAGNALTPTGAVAEQMVQVIDIAPTVLEAAGVIPTTPMHGSSFLGYLTAATDDEPATWREALYYHYQAGASSAHDVQKHYGVFDGRYKLINHYELNSPQQWELFDLGNDPLEMTNLLYNSSTGVIDNPEDGIEGNETFQALVRNLMIQLSDLRTQFNDTNGPGFSIPE